MIPLYKHIIQPIEAPFLDAYGEEIDVVSKMKPVGGGITESSLLDYEGEVVISGTTYYAFDSTSVGFATASRSPKVGDAVGKLSTQREQDTTISFSAGMTVGEVEMGTELPVIPYKGILVDKDDATKKVELSSKVHVIDEDAETSNENALVYFEATEADTHTFEPGTKLIWNIYRTDRKGFWTSKSAAFKVTETSITDPTTTTV